MNRCRLVALAALVAVAGLAGATPAGAQPDGDEASRLRLISEFSAAVSRPGTPDDLCLTVYLNGELIHETESEPLAPASLMKIATAAVALEVMGPDATYTTEVAAGAAALAGVSDGVLDGDLYLIGGGDPTLSTPGYMSTLLRSRAFTDVNDLADTVMASLRAHGIRVVNGAVVGDESRYGVERDYASPLPSGERVWKTSYVSTNLAGPMSALMINDGYRPYRTSRRTRVRPSNPAQAAAALFDDLLEARGMIIRRSPRSAESPPETQRSSLGRLTSVPMSEIVERVLAHSDNTTAEMLLKEIGHRTGAGSLRRQAAASATGVLRGMLGTEADTVAWFDGSGLSIHNRMTCRAVARILDQAGPDSVLVGALAVAGRTGTMRNCGPRAPAGSTAPLNELMVKSGSLNDTDSLAGVALAPNGDVVTFAMIASEHLIITEGGCNSLRRGLMDAAARYTYGPQRPVEENPEVPAEAPVAGAPLLLTSVPDDMPTGVHAPGVQELVAAQVALACDGEGRRFCPQQPISRSEVAWYLAELLDLAPSPTPVHFTDVDPDDRFAASIAALAHAQITQGCGRGDRFCGDRSLTRAESASFLSRAFALAPSPTPVRFVDVDAESPHAASIAALAHAQITQGCDGDGRFCGDSAVTRAEFATFLSRALAR